MAEPFKVNMWEETSEPRSCPASAPKQFTAKGLVKEPEMDKGLHHLFKGQLGDLTTDEPPWPMEKAATEPTSWEVLKAIPVGIPAQIPLSGHVKGRPPGERH